MTTTTTLNTVAENNPQFYISHLFGLRVHYHVLHHVGSLVNHHVHHHVGHLVNLHIHHPHEHLGVQLHEANNHICNVCFTFEVYKQFEIVYTLATKRSRFLVYNIFSRSSRFSSTTFSFTIFYTIIISLQVNFNNILHPWL